MKRPQRRSSTRPPTARRLAFWAGLTLGATLLGALLGKMAVGDRLRVVGSAQQSFASLSANPDAATVDSVAHADCIFCPDSFGIGAKSRDRAAETEYAYPYAPVEVSPSLGNAAATAENVDRQPNDYQYGGNFPARTPSSTAGSGRAFSDLLPEARSLGSKALERPAAQNSSATAPPEKIVQPSEQLMPLPVTEKGKTQSKAETE